MSWRKAIPLFFAGLVVHSLTLTMLSSEQGENDLASILQKIKAYRQSITDIRQEYAISTDKKIDQHSKHSEAKLSVAMKRPNLLRAELASEPPILAVSDGVWLWTVLGRNRSYAKKQAPNQLSLLNDWIGIFIPIQTENISVFYPTSESLIQQVKLLGRENLETNSGNKITCYVLEGQLNETTLTSWNYQQGQVKVWINTNNLITEKMELTLRAASQTTQNQIKTTILNVSTKINQGIENSFFSFTPPDKSK